MVNEFFEDLMRWKSWVEDGLRNARKRLEIAHAKPPRAEHDSNLYMAEDGTIWASYGDMWYELTRSSNTLFAEYKKTPRFKRVKEEVARGSVQSVERPDGTRLVFVKRSWIEHEEEDWGWQIKNPGSWPGPHPTAQHIERGILLDERGIQLANTLLEKREQIEEWMMAYAESQGELRATDRNTLNRDWDSLMERFAPGLKGLDVPDNGSLLCNLHAVLDQLALGRQVRMYMH